jgi:hypothetical protein
MKQDEIIEMACQAFGGLIKQEERQNFIAFAKLVAAKAFQEGYSIGESAGFKEGIKLERKTRGEA